MRIMAVTLSSLLLAASAFAEVDLDDIELPPGFTIEVYAEVPNARSLTAGPGDTVFVANRSGDSVYAIVPAPSGGNRVIEVDSGLDSPNGIAYRDGDLYVAEVSRVLVYRDIDGRLSNAPEPDVLPIELPSERHHGWRYIAFGPDGKLYISIGAPCNVCERDGFAQIIRTNTDGSAREVVARGVRNSVGFAWHPETKNLWFTDNGRDMLGDDRPPCELNRLTEPGTHFGFPYCHGRDIADPQFGDARDCDEFAPPAQPLGPHVAPLGMAFYTGEAFPAEYRGQIFIAEHGSWNRSSKIGYRVTLVRLEDGKAVSYETFASGWLDGETTLGRPVDVLARPDGSMLVSDDYNGTVYRISYAGAATARAVRPLIAAPEQETKTR